MKRGSLCGPSVRPGAFGNEQTKAMFDATRPIQQQLCYFGSPIAYLPHLSRARNSEGGMLHARDKNMNREQDSHNRQDSEKNPEQQRRSPGNEQQGDQSSQRHGNVDQERSEKERKSA